jgi:tetratricopeptide (TPR) repeat protein
VAATLFTSAAAPASDPGTPPEPWAAYNAGVAAYARGDFTNALQRWEDLSIRHLPQRLRVPVWFQLGNAQFRLGEPLAAGAPEDAAEWWRRSREAYRAALAEQPRDPAARHNLALVERRLSRLLQRLGREAFDAADGQPLTDALNVLRDSTRHLDEAAEVAPNDHEIRADRDRATRRLQQTLLERAAQAEKRGDESASQKNAWADRAAEREYRAALDDLDEISPLSSAGDSRPDQARPPEAPALPPLAGEARERVQRKLADLLTRIGQGEQRQAGQLSEWNPDEALDSFAAALGRFTDAQDIQPDHADAARGAREVRSAMEKLLVREGEAQLREGRDQLARQSPSAARPLEAALGNFERALQLRPTSVPAQNGAEEARRLLPAALALAGRAELEAGDRAAQPSPATALGHYQQAESDFEQSLERRPDQPAVRAGLTEVRSKLAQLRKRLAQDAETAARQRAENRPTPSLDSLLGEVHERARPRDDDRQRQRGRKDLGTRRSVLDW